jgi:hypothetical protein
VTRSPDENSSRLITLESSNTINNQNKRQGQLISLFSSQLLLAASLFLRFFVSFIFGQVALAIDSQTPLFASCCLISRKNSKVGRRRLLRSVFLLNYFEPGGEGISVTSRRRKAEKAAALNRGRECNFENSWTSKFEKFCAGRWRNARARSIY